MTDMQHGGFDIRHPKDPPSKGSMVFAGLAVVSLAVFGLAKTGLVEIGRELEYFGAMVPLFALLAIILWALWYVRNYWAP